MQPHVTPQKQHMDISDCSGSSSSGKALDSEVLVNVQNVSKKFCRDLKRSLWYGIKDVVTELSPGRRPANHNTGGGLRQGEFWAVNEVSFQLRRGECLGLVGHNGAGKTTLLKMLNGLIKPDSGSITMRGRVGALIALGAGFNPILTGRENIYINGAVLGLSKKEIDEQIDSIIEFAEIREFIDAPVQSYSSGMQVRLGFAVATAMRPDVLILDEVLAVGDAAFRAKCFKRIGSIARNCAIIFVSHDQSQVARICTQALLMDAGRSVLEGSTTAVIDQHNKLQAAKSGVQSTLQTHDSILSVEVVNSHVPSTVRAGGPLDILLAIKSREHLKVGIAFVNFIDLSGAAAGQADFSASMHAIPQGDSVLRLPLERVDLAQGIYSLNLAVFADNRQETLVHAVACAQVSVEGAPYMWCAYKMPVRKAEFSQAA